MLWYEGKYPEDLAKFVDANPTITVIDIAMQENSRWVMFYLP